MDTNQVTADATIALAVVGGLAFISSVGLAWFTLNAARATRRSAAATEKAAAATENAALATQAAATATQQEADATREEASATKQMVAEVQADRDLNWRPYLRQAGGGTSDALEGADQIGWRNIGRGPALNVVCARLYYVKADLGGVMRDVPQWHLSPGTEIIEAGGTQTLNLVTPPGSGSASIVLFDVLPPGQLNLTVFFQAIVGRRAYRLCPPRAEPDVWTPGDKVEPWVSWYFGHIGLQVPAPSP